MPTASNASVLAELRVVAFVTFKWRVHSRSLLLLDVVISESAQTSDGRLGSHGGGSCQLPRATSDLASSLLAFPDADGFSPDAFLQGVSDSRDLPFLRRG